MTDMPIQDARPASPPLSRPGLLFAALGLAGLALPLVQFKANRIVLGEGVLLGNAIGPLGWGLTALLALALLAGISGRLPFGLRLVLGAGGVVAALLALGAAARFLTPEGNTVARVAPSSGFWLLFLAFALMATDALSRMRLTLAQRWLLVGAAIVVIGGVLW